MLSDDDHIEAFCATGDRRHFEFIVMRHLGLIRRLLFSLLHGNHVDMQDAEQKVLLRLFVSLPRYAGASAFSTYLTRLIRNTAIDEIRKHQRHRKIAERVLAFPPEPTHHDEPLKALVEEQERADVISALDRLKTDERFVLYMKDAEGWSLAEISEALAKPIEPTHKLLFAADADSILKLAPTFYAQ